MSLFPATTRRWFQRGTDAPTNARPQKIAVTGGAAASAMVLGAAVARGIPVPRRVVLPLLGEALLLLAASSTWFRSWQLALGVLLNWLVVEDLVRKPSGNDIRIYFVRYAIYPMLLISLASRAKARVDEWGPSQYCEAFARAFLSQRAQAA